MPFFSVTVLESHVLQAPRSLSNTCPSWKPRNSISPPSSWMEGRILVSKSSLIILTTSLSFSSYANESISFPSCPLSSPALSATVLIRGCPEVTASVINEKTSGLTCAHGVALSLVTVMKSGPKNTEDTPSTLSKFAASGEGLGGWRVDRGDVYSKNVEGKSSGRMRWLGLNFRAWNLINNGPRWELKSTHVRIWCILCLDENGSP